MAQEKLMAVANDGKIFNTMKEAIEHEHWIAWVNFCRKHDIMDPEDIFDVRAEVIKLLSAFPNKSE